MCLSCFSYPFPFVFFSISLIALILAAETDLKERIVPNKLSYGLIVMGLGLSAWTGFLQSEFSLLMNSVIAATYAFALGYALYKFGVWAGGDVKLFTGIAALNPMNLNMLWLFGIHVELFKTIELPVFPITLFVFSILCMFPYGAMLGVKKLKGKNFLEELGKKGKGIVLFSGFITGFYALLSFFEIHYLFVLVGVILFGLVEKKWRGIAVVLSIGLFAFALWNDLLGSLIEFGYLFVFLLVAFVLIKLFFASKELFKKEVKISALEEGMIVGENIYLEKGKIKRGESLSIGKVINYLKHNKLEELMKSLKGNKDEIVGTRKARGVTEEEIMELRKLVKEGKLGDKISVQESAPMVPAILLAYIILNIVGDLFWNLVFL